MNYSKVYSATTQGLQVFIVEIEVSIELRGFPSFNIVGLGDKSVTEAKERVRSAIKSSGFKFPRGRITVNLAPTFLVKKGSFFDLAVAVGILMASGQLTVPGQKTIFLGELSLEGEVRAITGTLPILLHSLKLHFLNFIIPESNRLEAALIHGAVCYPVLSLVQVSGHLTRKHIIKPLESLEFGSVVSKNFNQSDPDFQDIKGCTVPKRALEIAAAGSHNIALKGSPGSGKTLLSKALKGILPDITYVECLEVLKVYSLYTKSVHDLIGVRPFRSPHYSISLTTLIGTAQVPGEISLAHRGVLLLDEVNEMSRNVVNSLRQPLEDGYISFSKGGVSFKYPCRFLMVAAFNPCPCGYKGDPYTKCKCSPYQISLYEKRLSGPIIDRIDLFVSLHTQTSIELECDSHYSTMAMKNRVSLARKIQASRYKDTNYFTNSDLDAFGLKKFCTLDADTTTFLNKALDAYKFSLRTYARILKVARTIADLEGAPIIKISHLAEALQFRMGVSVRI